MALVKTVLSENLEEMMVPGGFTGDLRSPHCISDNLEVVQAENGILRLAVSIFLTSCDTFDLGGRLQAKLRGW